MLYITVVLTSLFSSVIGSICGVGGGVIIKPVMDSLGLMSIAAVSFLSSMTVLSMSAYNTAANIITGNMKLDKRVDIPVAVGAATGGIIGKIIFNAIQISVQNTKTVGLVQSIVLLLLVIATLVMYLKKDKLHTFHVTNPAVSALIGLGLGVMASFLGIGGGPFNLIVLYIAFSMKTKQSVRTSLLVILFSQIANLIYSLISGSTPQFNIWILILMMICAVVGGIIGKAINGKLDDRKVDILFDFLLVIIIGICIYNVIKYS